MSGLFEPQFFRREDETPDLEFYREPRLTVHIDEYAIAAYYVGEHRECLAACEQLLAEGKLPGQHRERVAQNRVIALDALAKLPPDRREKNRAKQERKKRR